MRAGLILPIGEWSDLPSDRTRPVETMTQDRRKRDDLSEQAAVAGLFTRLCLR